MPPTLFLVDDDDDVRATLASVFRRRNFEVVCFSRGDEFLAALQVRNAGCILLDLQMPGLSGIQLLRILFDQKRNIPAFMMSGVADIPIAIEAIRMGALDFFEKPFHASDVIDRVLTNLDAHRQRSGRENRAGSNEALTVDVLTEREKEVLSFISKGNSSKEAARLMGISPRTIEVHRSRILEKMNAKNFVEVSHRLFSERTR